MIIRPHDPNGENPAARPLQLRRSDILQPGTSVPGTLPHRDHAPIGRNLTVTKREKATLASHLAFRRRERAALWRAGAPSAEIPNEVRDLPKGKGRPGFHDRPLFYAGDDLLSHTLSRAVQSALRGLTAVFGMGTGGSPAVRSPTNLRGVAWRLSRAPKSRAKPRDLYATYSQRTRERSLTTE